MDGTDVDDGERVARFCDRSNVKASGVRFHAFIMTRFPTELSVDRVALCDPEARAARETLEQKRSRTFVLVVVGEARAIESVSVHAKPLTCPPDDRDAPEHAEIHFHADGAKVYASKDEMQACADLWKKHVDACMALAKIARARDCDRPNAN